MVWRDLNDDGGLSYGGLWGLGGLRLALVCSIALGIAKVMAYKAISKHLLYCAFLKDME